METLIDKCLHIHKTYCDKRPSRDRPCLQIKRGLSLFLTFQFLDRGNEFLDREIDSVGREGDLTVSGDVAFSIEEPHI